MDVYFHFLYLRALKSRNNNDYKQLIKWQHYKVFGLKDL